jgi:hypothetical protein
MCFLNKLLLLAVLGWLFQVGRMMVQIGGVGEWLCVATVVEPGSGRRLVST